MKGTKRCETCHGTGNVLIDRHTIERCADCTGTVATWLTTFAAAIAAIGAWTTHVLGRAV